MESESESNTAMSMEVLSLLMKRRRLRGIVALKGLPSTCKTEVAHHIGRRVNCPVLCIQDFLGEGAGYTCYAKGAEADFSPPTSPDQVERHHRKAFTSLLSVAHRLLYEVCNCVVIKSNLNTQFELQQLLQLTGRFYPIKLIIIECKIRNKYLWKRRFEEFFARFDESWSWCRPTSWKDIEKASDDDHHPPSWDVNHFHLLVQGMPLAAQVIWLWVDPFYDLSLRHNYTSSDPLPDEFKDAIMYLLTVPKLDLYQNPYVAEYDQLRLFLFDEKLRAVARKGRSKSFCQAGDCVFRYWPVLEDYGGLFCDVCTAKISSQLAYTCRFCISTMHKTCGEKIDIEGLVSMPLYRVFKSFMRRLLTYEACKACKGGRRSFSKECRSCLFQHRVQCHKMPIVLNHNCHGHFLSIQRFDKYFHCKACGINHRGSYGCKRCAFYCHMDCAFLPLESKHEHGGHEHVMKLMYTRDAMEVEEDPCWCDFCYEDMDPELWFYSCQVCPHYIVHLRCSGGYHLHANNPKMVKFVDQLQSQLDNWRAAKELCNER